MLCLLDCRMDSQGSMIWILVGSSDFFIPEESSLALGSMHFLIHWELGCLSPGVKWPGQVVDHTPAFGIEIKNAWKYTSTPPYTFKCGA